MIIQLLMPCNQMIIVGISQFLNTVRSYTAVLVNCSATPEDDRLQSRQGNCQKCTNFYTILMQISGSPEVLFAVPHLSSFHSLYLLLQLKNTIQQCLCRWWTAWYIYVNWDNTIASSNNWIWVVIISTTIGTASHGDDPFRVICLIINSA